VYAVSAFRRTRPAEVAAWWSAPAEQEALDARQSGPRAPVDLQHTPYGHKSGRHLSASCGSARSATHAVSLLSVRELSSRGALSSRAPSQIA
jgi:hypothetical protein